MKKILKIVAFIAAGLLLVMAVALIAFYHLIQVGELRRFLVSEFEQHTGLKVEVGKAEVELGKVVGVSFHDFALREPEQGRPVITAPRIVIRVALLPLLERRLVFYGVRLYEPRLQLARDEQGRMAWLDPLVALSFHKQQAAEFSVDLREIRIEKGDIAFIDRFGVKDPVLTRFQEIDLNLQRMRTKGLLGWALRLKNRGGAAPQEGIRFKVRTMLGRSGRQADLSAAGRALFPEATLDIRKAWFEADLEAESLPAALLWEHYGRPIADAAPRGDLAYRVRWEGNLSEGARIKGEVRFAELEAEARNIFASPLKLGGGRIDLALAWKPREIRIERANFRSENLTFDLNGALGFLGGEDSRVDLHLTTPFLSLAGARQFVPAKLFSAPRLENVLASIRQGEIKFVRADVSVKLSELGRLFEPGQEDRLSLEAQVKDAGGDFGADTPLPLRGFSGQIALEKGVLRYENFKGAVGQSRLTEINGTHRGVLSGPGKLDLRVKGETDLAQFSEMARFGILPPAAAKMAGAVRELGGGAKFDLTIRTDFASSHEYQGIVSLDAVQARIGETAFSQIRGDLLFSQTEIRADQATAFLSGSPVQLRLQVKNFAAEDGTFDLAVSSAGLKAGEALRLLLSLDAPQSPGFVRGAVRYQGSLAAAEKRRLTGSLELVGIQIPLKVFSQPFNEVHGRVQLDGKTIDLQGVRAQAGGFPFSLNGRWVNGEKPMLLFSLSAPEMDIAYLLPRHVTPDEEWYDRLQVRGKIILDKGRYQKFSFADFKSDLVLEKRIWRLENFFARSQGGTVEGPASFDDHPDKQLFRVEPDIKGVPVGDLLGWFDIGTTEITGKVQLAGKLEFSGKTAAERKRNLNGAFRVRIEDGVARRFQLMVRILSFLDLSRWFTLRLPNANQEGIHFRSISGDVKVAEGVYSTQNLFVDGDDLRITGAGELDGPKGEINFVIAARPFPGLDTAANYIPILGTGLAAIKNSFLVASFNVRGPINDPAITPAPLSTLSEYFFGVLAIPKGLIGLPTTGEPRPDGETKPPPEQTPGGQQP